MEKQYEPMTLSEVSWWVNKAKNLPRPDAEDIQRYLLDRALDVGMSSSDVRDKICSITDRFVDEDNETRRQLMAEDLRRKGILEQEKIDADDDQIVQAIKWTLPKFQSDWDWGGLYRILVDCCDFPAAKTDFVRRMARMGIYPKDDKPKDLKRLVPPSIRGTEWYDHPFNYQAVQKGVKPSWPDSYFGWQNSEIQDRDFLDRRTIAKTFKSNLFKALKEA